MIFSFIHLSGYKNFRSEVHKILVLVLRRVTPAALKMVGTRSASETNAPVAPAFTVGSV